MSAEDDTTLVPRRTAAEMTLIPSLFGVFFFAFMAFALYQDVAPSVYEPAKGLQFPALTGRIVDEAGILTDGAEREIKRASEKLEAETGAQLVVSTTASLQGTTIEDYGYQLGRHWGIGRKGYDDGVLLLIAPNDRTTRIEVGYGLEGILTDALSSDIINNILLPAFRDEKYSSGTLAAVQRIAGIIAAPENKAHLPAEGAVAGGDGPRNAPSGRANGLPMEWWLILSLIGAFALIPVYGVVRWLRCLVDEKYASEMVARPRSGRGDNNRWGGPGGGGSSSGGGFRGGGGSFGGGGASGRW